MSTVRPRRRTGAGPALGALVLLALGLTACRSSGKAAPRSEPVRLRGIAARCSSIRGETVGTEPPTTLVFESETRISGHTGLNAYTGRYERGEGAALAFSRIGSTRMAGSSELMLRETSYLTALGQIDEFVLEGDELRLLAQGEVLLVFTPLAPGGFRSAAEQRRLHSDDWPPATDPQADWIRLRSGEWLKGEIESMTRKTLEFESNELDALTLDYENVAEIHTKRPFTVVFDDQTVSAFADKPEAIGQIHLEGNTVFVKTDTETKRFKRDDLYLMVPGLPRESNYWSADVLLGVAIRSGNTNQTDVTLSASARRRTAQSRVQAKLDTVYGEQSDVEIANNQRLTGSYDVFLSRRFFVTPFGIELYKDRFQNIELRAAPFAGIGYTLVDRSTYEHDVILAAGYRSTTFDSAPPGGVDKVETATANIGTSLSANLTPKIELEGSYGAQISLEDAEDTNQVAFVGLSFDFWKDFDLDVRVNWNRVGRPEPGDDGLTPKQDDLRVDVGLSWSF